MLVFLDEDPPKTGQADENVRGENSGGNVDPPIKSGESLPSNSNNHVLITNTNNHIPVKFVVERSATPTRNSRKREHGLMGRFGDIANDLVTDRDSDVALASF